MDATFIGAGPVGTVSGVSLALRGHTVRLVDRDARIVRSLQEGTAPFFEPGLEPVLREALATGRLQATTDLSAAVQAGDCVFLSVGTPLGEGGGIDLSAVSTACAQIAAVPCTDGRTRTLVVKSTVIPGTAEGVVAPALAASAGSWRIVSNPEFLREGTALEDALHPDRIVIGASEPEGFEILETLYASFAAPAVRMSPAAAEMTKYTSNALLATLISFANEIAEICERLPGVSAEAVLRAVHLDRRFRADPDAMAGIVGYLLPGWGFGGSCLPKDVAALAQFAAGQGVQSSLLRAVAAINAERPARVLARTAERLGGFAGRTVAVLGASFKPDSDDMRNSPAIPVVETLLEQDARVRLWDREGLPAARDRWGERAGITYADSVLGALADADAALIVTAWPEVRTLDPAAAAACMRRPLVIDGRGALRGRSLAPLEYWAVGDGPGA